MTGLSQNVVTWVGAVYGWNRAPARRLFVVIILLHCCNIEGQIQRFEIMNRIFDVVLLALLSSLDGFSFDSHSLGKNLA